MAGSFKIRLVAAFHPPSDPQIPETLSGWIKGWPITAVIIGAFWGVIWFLARVLLGQFAKRLEEGTKKMDELSAKIDGVTEKLDGYLSIREFEASVIGDRKEHEEFREDISTLAQQLADQRVKCAASKGRRAGDRC